MMDMKKISQLKKSNPSKRNETPKFLNQKAEESDFFIIFLKMNALIKGQGIGNVVYDRFYSNLNGVQTIDQLKKKVAQVKDSLKAQAAVNGGKNNVNDLLTLLRGGGLVNMNLIPGSEITTLIANSGKELQDGLLPDDLGLKINGITAAYINAMAEMVKDQTKVKSMEQLKTDAQANAKLIQAYGTDFVGLLNKGLNRMMDPKNENINLPGVVQNIFLAKRLQRLAAKVGAAVPSQYITPGSVAAVALDKNASTISQLRNLQAKAIKNGFKDGSSGIESFRPQSNLNNIAPRLLKEKGKLSRPDFANFNANYMPSKLTSEQKGAVFTQGFNMPINQGGLLPGKLPLFPFANETYKKRQLQAQTKLKNYMTKKAQLQDPATVWPSQLDDDVYYDPVPQKWVGVTKVGKKFLSNVDPANNYMRNRDQSTYLLKTTVDQQQMQTQMPTLVKQLVADNAQYSKYGIGPISKNSLSLYVGRWYDPVSGRVRILPAASRKLANTRDWGSMNEYYKTRVMNKWNQYVQSQQQYLKHQTTFSSYNAKQAERALKKSSIITSGQIFEDTYMEQIDYWVNYMLTPPQLLPQYKRKFTALLKPSILALRQGAADAGAALTAMDKAIDKIIQNVNTSKQATYANLFADTYSGRKNKEKALNWLNSQTALVARKILKELIARYKNNFDVNKANSSQMDDYREKLRILGNIGKAIKSKEYAAFTNDPIQYSNIDAVLSGLKLQRKFGQKLQ